MEEILIVDGYNVIGASHNQRLLDEMELEDARDWLIEKLAEYQGFTGVKIYIVFDAHMVAGIGKKYRQRRLEIIYTKENETADERIEKLVGELKRVQRQIYVATSDLTEQRVIFGQGALRKSSRELILELKSIDQKIKETVHENYQLKHRSTFPLDEKMAGIFEKWRRGK